MFLELGNYHVLVVMVIEHLCARLNYLYPGTLVHAPMYLFIYLFIHLFSYLFIYLVIYLFVYSYPN